MHIYESRGNYGTAEPILHLVGDEAETRAFRESLGSCLLGAVAEGSVSADEATSLAAVVMRSGGIMDQDREVLMGVREHAWHYNQARRGVVTSAAMEGNLPTSSWMEEMRIGADIGDVEYVLANGIVAYESDKQLSPKVDPIEELAEVFDEGAPELQMAEAGDYTHYAWQAEVVPDEDSVLPVHTELSGREHLSLGHVLPDGTYEPMLTVLHWDHPVRLGLTTEQDS